MVDREQIRSFDEKFTTTSEGKWVQVGVDKWVGRRVLDVKWNEARRILQSAGVHAHPHPAAHGSSSGGSNSSDRTVGGEPDPGASQEAVERCDTQGDTQELQAFAARYSVSVVRSCQKADQAELLPQAATVAGDRQRDPRYSRVIYLATTSCLAQSQQPACWIARVTRRQPSARDRTRRLWQVWRGSHNFNGHYWKPFVFI